MTIAESLEATKIYSVRAAAAGDAAAARAPLPRPASDHQLCRVSAGADPSPGGRDRARGGEALHERGCRFAVVLLTAGAGGPLITASPSYAAVRAPHAIKMIS